MEMARDVIQHQEKASELEKAALLKPIIPNGI